MAVQSSHPHPEEARPCKHTTVFIRRVVNGYLIECASGLIVLQGDGSGKDMEELLGLVKRLFEE